MQTISFGEPLEFWRRNMPAGMVLRSRDRSSSIADPRRAFTVSRFEAAEGRAVQKPHLQLEEFINYGLWFQRQVVPDLDRRRVTQVFQRNGGFRLELEGDVLDVARVVVAAGLLPFPTRPDPFAQLPDSFVSHAVDHTDLGVFAGKRVAVIGAGQSALESAALLSEAGAKAFVLARCAAVRWLASENGEQPPPRAAWIRISPPPTDVGGRLTGWVAAAPDIFRRIPQSAQAWVARRCVQPAGAGWLRPRLEQVEIACGRHVNHASVDHGQVRLTLSDGSEQLADHILLGTGYAVDVRRYPFLGPDLIAKLELRGGYPLLTRGLESSLPGLHFVGAPAALSFGPIMRFVVGTWYAAPAVARRVAGWRQPLLSLSF